ncbi:MAG: hypothetical protein KBS62_05270 [Oscillospiraceae bacterium]|nr:hypothetical protein [Candidatus Ruminococcus equi]
MNKRVLISQKGDFYKKLNKCSIKTTLTDKVGEFISFEQYHADMQCLMVEDTAFVLSCCKNVIDTLNEHYKVIVCDEYDAKYPDNIGLNALILGKTLVGKISSINPKIIDFCKKHNYSFINVNQGYTACSCAVVDETSVITADNSIYKVLTNNGYNVLKINEGHIKLTGADYGFIGGASAKIENILYFFGNIKKHPDYKRIKEFCNNRGVNIVSLSNCDLTDIGGIRLLNHWKALP